MGEEPEPLPYGLERIEGIADRLRGVLLERQDANRANYPPGAWNPGPLHWRFMEAIGGLMEAELVLFQAIQEIRTGRRRCQDRCPCHPGISA